MTFPAEFENIRVRLNEDADKVQVLVGGSGSPTGSVSFVLPSGYVATITQNGFETLKFNNVQLSAGGLQLIEGAWFYKASFTPPLAYPVVASKSFVALSNGAVVTHNYTGAATAKAVFTYTIVGNDIRVSVVVSNQGSLPIALPTFRSPSFWWDAFNTPGAVVSNGLGYGQDHTKASGEKLSYPSANVAFGATYAIGLAGGGVPLNMCTWSEEDPFEKFMTLAVGTFNVPGRNMLNFFFKEIPAGGSRAFKFAFRFASNDWKDLLGGYKTILRAKFPTLQYTLDARPIAYFASIDQSYIRANNPYGYNDGGDALCAGGGLCRRFDTLAGCQNFVAHLVGPMNQTGYQGVILWQPQGIHPRGIQYRPDFDNFPPVTIPNLPTLINGFRNAGLTIGVLARPGIAVTSKTYSTDGSITITDDAETALDIQTRLQWALTQGFNSFYLDSFIIRNVDHGILKVIRDKVGINVPTFTEFSTALSMGLSGSYETMKYANGAFVINSIKYPILRWIYPESIIAMKFVDPQPPGGFPVLFDYMFQNKLTPLIEDWRAQNLNPGQENSVLKPLVLQYIDSNHHWI